jgi:hypothetical protein
MRRLMKLDWTRILYLLVATFVLATQISCELLGEPEEPPPTTPIFSGVEKIELQAPWPPPNDTWSYISNSISFQFDIPSVVEYVVLALFTASIDVSGKTITNPNAWVAGNRSGLSGFSTSSTRADNLFPFDLGSGDFDTSLGNYTPSPPFPQTFYWAVWGYDQWGNLTHASPQWSLTATNP